MAIREYGRVKGFHRDANHRGWTYGFIEPDRRGFSRGPEQVFFHVQDVVEEDAPYLDVGTRVEYELAPPERGRGARAICVEIYRTDDEGEAVQWNESKEQSSFGTRTVAMALSRAGLASSSST